MGQKRDYQRAGRTASGWLAGASTVTTRWKGRLSQLKEVCLKSSEEKVVWPSISRRWHSPPSPWSYNPMPSLPSRRVPAVMTAYTGGSPPGLGPFAAKGPPTGLPSHETCTCSLGSVHFLCQNLLGLGLGSGFGLGLGSRARGLGQD